MDVDAVLLLAAAWVQRCRIGHPSQRRRNLAWRVRGLIATVISFGHVVVIVSRSMMKSSIVNPPGIAELRGPAR